jgi:hypothetical protein
MPPSPGTPLSTPAIASPDHGPPHPTGLVFETPLEELGFRLAIYAQDTHDHLTHPTTQTRLNVDTSALFLAHAVRWLLQGSPRTATTDLALHIPLPPRLFPVSHQETV